MVKALSAGQGTGSEPSTWVRSPGRFMTVTCPVCHVEDHWEAMIFLVEAARATVRVMFLTAMHQAWSGKSGRDTKEGEHMGLTLSWCVGQKRQSRRWGTSPQPRVARRKNGGNVVLRTVSGKRGAGCAS